MTRCSRLCNGPLDLYRPERASQTLYEQQISANNLANVNTNGFRADMAMATNDKVKGGGFDTRYMAQEGVSGVNDSTGVAEKTERPLDVAIQGAGYCGAG